MIEILIPTFQRPERLSEVYFNARINTFSEASITFIVESDDIQSIAVLQRLDYRYLINQGPRNYAGAINTAYRSSDADFLFCGADDLNFHPGWDLALLKVVDPWFDVYGTNDLFNPYVLDGSHATHYLVRREYLDKIGGKVDDGPRSFLNDAYSHNYTDTEFIWTAKARAKFRPVLDSVVEHRHWAASKNPKDTTYLKGEEHIATDRQLYISRRELWLNVSL